jgi:hypothetical protein
MPTKTISKKTLREIADRIEGVIDHVPAWDGLPYYVRRSAAVKATYALIEVLEANDAD